MDHPAALPSIIDAIEFAKFDSNYIYGATSSYVSMQKLLSRNERERLIGADSMESFMIALKETFLGKYLAGDGDVEKALGAAILDVKKDIERNIPDPHLSNILFLRYDFYNLKTLLKLSEAELEKPEVVNRLLPLGTHDPMTLVKAVLKGNGTSLAPALARALSDAPKDRENIDNVMECRYLDAAHEEAEMSEKAFGLRYIHLLTNLFTIIAGLRAHARGKTPMRPDCSLIGSKELADPEALLRHLANIGWSTHWNEAVAAYKERGDFSILDKAMDDFMMKWIKRQAVQIDSTAPFFARWHVMRENIAFVRATYTAHKVHLPEKTLRDIIRTSYHAYVY